jgi:hypothetical protein
MRAVRCSSSPWSHLADLRLPRARPPRRVRPGLPQAVKVGAPSVFVTLSAWGLILLALVFVGWTLLRSAELLNLQPGLFGLGLLLSLSTLGAAVGTLRRHDGARRALIGLLAVAIGIHLGSLLLQHALLPLLLEPALAWAVGPAQAFELFGGLSGAARWIGAGLTLAGCGLLIGVIRGLRTPAVRREFS